MLSSSLAGTGAVRPALAANFSFASGIQAAAAARGVPIPLLLAVTYVNTRWEVIPEPADDKGVGPMHILPSQLALAAALSGHTPGEVASDPAANLDAGAALLASLHSSGSDLTSWQSAVTQFQGPYVSAQVYSVLASGVTRTTSTGERMALTSQRLPASSQAAPGQAPSAPGTPAAATSPDYAPAAWVPASPSNYSVFNRPHDSQINLIIIHDTEGSYGSAIQEFQNGASQASAHYVVADSGAITQMVREKDVAWHAGNWDYNTRAIGIEHEGFAYRTGWYTTAMYQTSAHLAASICSRYGVPMDRAHVIGHAEVPDPNNPGQYGGAGHHTDPGPYWDWATYMNLAQSYASALPSPPHMGPDPYAQGAGSSIVVSWDPAQSCHSPITGYKVVGQPGNLSMTLPAGATRATFSGVSRGNYTFVVTAINAEGQDNANAISLPWVDASVAPSQSTTAVQLSFAASYKGTLSSFDVESYDDTLNQGPFDIATGVGATGSASSGSWSGGLTVSGYPGHQYHYRTRAWTYDGYVSDWSSSGAAAVTTVAANATYARQFKGMYTVRADGYLLADASPPLISGGAFSPGSDFARAVHALPPRSNPPSSGAILGVNGWLYPYGAGTGTLTFNGLHTTALGARDFAFLADGTGGYVLTSRGDLLPFGVGSHSPPPATQGNPHWGSDVARKVVLFDDGTGGYILDYTGVPNAFGVGRPAPPQAKLNRYWPDQDFARAMVLIPGTHSGYVMNGWGGLYPFQAPGDQYPVVPAGYPYWPGHDVARDVWLLPSSTAGQPGGYIMDCNGGLTKLGSADPAGVPTPDWSGCWLARGMTGS